MINIYLVNIAKSRFNLSTFPQAYTRNLCKMDCRIRRALKFCGCMPFFYAVSGVKVCDIDGMLCLARHANETRFDAKNPGSKNWYNTDNCTCLSLCETVIMTKMSTKQVFHLFYCNGEMTISTYNYSKTYRSIAC